MKERFCKDCMYIVAANDGDDTVFMCFKTIRFKKNAVGELVPDEGSIAVKCSVKNKKKDCKDYKAPWYKPWAWR